MRSDDLATLPDDLPVPIDDGVCDHLVGRVIPDVELRSTSGGTVRLDRIEERTVVFIYPRMGHPDRDPPGGAAAWNAIPGARGCTPEACGYRDLHAELLRFVGAVYGLSTQRSDQQEEAAKRLGLPYELLSDSEMALTHRMRLPTFDAASGTHLRRATLVIRAARVEHVFYPCFPPDRDAERVIEWLSAHPVADR
jgi:peroxiredoxin